MHIGAVSKKKIYRIPDGRIAYSDLNIPAKALFSKRYRIAGKPDYIVKRNHHYIPIEVKSGSYPNPQRNHILQLATYCQLIEDNYRDFVPYGIIIYKDSDFKIPFDPKLRFELASVINEIRGSLKNDKIVLNHNDPGRCRFCSMRSYCTEKLV
ncbi:MAG: CRISPR-associated protein Cas4 [Thermoplasmatales archaeon]|nr:MAG: CRISPR-associated protein Cas4 [Thermoplasmatales archaeon]